MTPRRVAVIDIGKTNAKLALVDTSDLSEIDLLSQPNGVREEGPYPHADVEAIWAFLLEGLEQFQREHGIDAISVTTHGATGALLGPDGDLAAPILDYEHEGPEEVSEAYDALRPAFQETGSPRLPMGLNLGAQIHWQFERDPDLRARTAAIVTYPQYWGHRLTGVLACDPSSLGAHTDLWTPARGEVSALVARLGLSDKLAPARAPSEVLGPLLPEVAARTGLAPTTPVLCGIHDSNASLLPHLLQRAPPFSVVSTGTWVIVMTLGGAEVDLDPARDTLLNVSALGGAVPSARFMGGREFELIRAGQSVAYDAGTMAAMAARGPMLMPAVVPESGPFQGRKWHWVGEEPNPGTPERALALSFYLALMTAECLALSGHRGEIVVEGPFAANKGYGVMLAAATECPVLVTESATGTSAGAALLALEPDALPSLPEARVISPDLGRTYAPYAARWRAALAAAAW